MRKNNLRRKYFTFQTREHVVQMGVIAVTQVQAFVIFALSIVIIMGVTAIAPARATTHANWAWPGMSFVVKRDSWYTCSAGFPASDNARNHYFITAGHCFRSRNGGIHYFEDVFRRTGLQVYNPDDVHHPIGFERVFMIPGGRNIVDVSLVQMYPGKKLHQGGWQHIPNEPEFGLIGDDACLAGQRHHDFTCGHITATNETMIPNGYEFEVYGLTSASYCGVPGDSGGAVFNKYGALGINIVGDGMCRSGFVPITEVLRALRTVIPSLVIV